MLNIKYLLQKSVNSVFPKFLNNKVFVFCCFTDFEVLGQREIVLLRKWFLEARWVPRIRWINESQNFGTRTIRDRIVQSGLTTILAAREWVVIANSYFLSPFEVLCCVVIISDKKWQCVLWDDGWPSSEDFTSVTNVDPSCQRLHAQTSMLTGRGGSGNGKAGKLLVRFADTLPRPWPLYRASQCTCTVQPPFYYTILEEDIKQN